MAWFNSSNFAGDERIANDFENKVLVNASNMNTLVDEMVDPDFFQQFWQKIADWVGSIVVYPFSPPNGNENRNLMIGSVESKAVGSSLTPIALFRIAEYYCEPILNNFADYNGYSRVLVYLPYNGIVELAPNDVVGKYIEVLLSISWSTGEGTYYIAVSSDSIPTPNEFELTPWRIYPTDYRTARIVGTYTCQIGHTVPIGQTNAEDIKRNAVFGSVRSAANLVVGGAAAAATFLAGASNPVTAAIGAGAAIGTAGQFISSTLDTIQNMHVTAQTDRPNSQQALRAGSESCYFIRLMPKIIAADDNYNRLYGKPLMQVKFLETLTGYTVISEVHVEGTGFETATNEEVDEVYNLLRSGIIL